MDIERALDALSSLPLISRLDPEARRALASAVRPARFNPGERIVQEHEPAEDLLLLVSGELSIVQSGRLTRLTHAPTVLGVLAVLDQGRRTASLEASSEVELLMLHQDDLWRLTREQPSFNASLLDWLGGELGRMYRREQAWLEHMADFFHSPNARIVTGPYEAAPYEMLFMVMQGDPAALSELMPPGVEPLGPLEGIFILSFNFFGSLFSTNPFGEERSLGYRETGIFIPCVGPRGRMGVFCPEMYPDNYLAITIGRELYGLPKRFASTVRRGEQVDLLLDDRLVARARWRGEEPCTLVDLCDAMYEGAGAHPAVGFLAGQIVRAMNSVGDRLGERRLPLRLPLFVHRQVPAVHSEARHIYAEDKLIEVPFHLAPIRKVRRLSEPRVSCHHPDHFLQGRCVAGFSVEVAFAMDQHTVLRDYLGEAREQAAPQGLLGRVRRRLGRSGRIER
jgi:hypothetical protein